MHSQSSLCPNCSRSMVIARTIPGALDEPEVNVFECSRCRVDFITEAGLGTGIVKALAKQHDAQVVTSRGPHGTTVSVTHSTFATKEIRAA